MKEPKEFHPIDDFYRKTLENLPENPVEPGWDAPSERVWQQVQQGIRPASTWPKMLGAAAIIALVATAAYVFLAPPEQPGAQPVETPQPAQQQLETAPEMASPTQPAAAQPPVLPKTRPAGNAPQNVAPQPHNTTEAGASNASPMPVPQVVEPAATPPSPSATSAQPVENQPKTEAKPDQSQKPAAKKLPPPPNHTELEKAKQQGGN